MTPPYHSGVVEAAGRWAPLGLIYIAGSLRAAGFPVEIYDAMGLDHDYGQIRRRLQEVRPTCLATGAYTSSLPEALTCLALGKELDPEVITVLGGVHPSFCYEEVLQRNSRIVDYIVRGEGEETVRELLETLERGGEPAEVRGIAFLREGKVVVPPQRAFVEDLDALTPAWDLLPWEEYSFFVLPRTRLAPLQTSRGCVNACTFCSQQRFWRRTYRQRGVKGILADIQELYHGYGVNVFSLTDEYPTRDRDRWEGLLEGIIRLDLDALFLMETCVKDILRDADLLWKYRRAGFVHIYVGVESTDQRTLDEFKKDLSCEDSREAIRLLNQAGIVSECSFLLGRPEESPESIEETLRLAFHYDPRFPHFILFAPWPYEGMYEGLREYIEVEDYSRYNFVEPVMRSRYMSRPQLQEAVIDCYRRYYTQKVPQYLELRDPFLRKYLLKAVELMAERSFLSKHRQKLGLWAMDGDKVKSV